MQAAILLCILLLGCASPGYRGMLEVGATQQGTTRCALMVGRGVAVKCNF